MHLRKAGGVSNLSKCIETNLIEKKVSIELRLIVALSDCAAASLVTRSVNSSEWINVMPNICCSKAQENRIRRLLKNKRIITWEIMKSFAQEVISILLVKDKTIIIIIDQSQIQKDRQCLMVSIRFGERALPVAWIIKDTKGSIGFEEQEDLLNKVLEMIPEGTDVMLAGDRFYGTKALVEWCQKAMWHYRIRLKGNLIFQHEGGEIKAEEVGGFPESRAINAKFNGSEISTNIGYLHEEGHEEAWIIAMDCKPSEYKVLDYGMRWGIECLFSDVKSRGFSVTKTHLKDPERMERLLLILSIAAYWGTSAGLSTEESEEIEAEYEEEIEAEYVEKEETQPKRSAKEANQTKIKVKKTKKVKEMRYTEKKQARSQKSLLTKGLLLLLSIAVSSGEIPVLWGYVPWVT